MTMVRDQARELLAFYREAGVDALLEETPTDRFAGDEGLPLAETARAGAKAPTSAAARSLPPRERGVESRIAPPQPPEAAVVAAREAAKSAATLEQLRTMLDRFQGCALRTTATQLVSADGNPKARGMFVGEAPGRDEDIEGLPFVGRSGKLLDRMMAAIGLDRGRAYIANIIPWRPPGKRTPPPPPAPRPRRRPRSACPSPCARSSSPRPTSWCASAARPPKPCSACARAS